MDIVETKVLIVGAGPSGLATSACLNVHSIPNIILEKEPSCATLWKSRTYDRLKIHLAKQFCSLPHSPFPSNTPTFIPKNEFIQYLDKYVCQFNINPIYCKFVESASFDAEAKQWSVMAHDTKTGASHVYMAGFLVIATGENAEGLIPETKGLESFSGTVIHSSCYKSGSSYAGKKVLVVGGGNSAMEIAYDLSNFGAMTCISIRSPVHVVTKEIVYVAMVLLKYLPLSLVDALVVILCKLIFANMSKYGIVRPIKGPFYLKAATGRSPVIDVGTAKRIRDREIQVFPTIANVKGNVVAFSDGRLQIFDSIIFATGYKSTANRWLKDENHLLNKDGLPNQKFPNHWKGKNGLYCAGLSQRGLAGISMDAQNIANDIKKILNTNQVSIAKMSSVHPLSLP